MRTLTLLATLAATPAWATCPTGADLATGITFTSDAGDRDTFTSIGNGVVQIDGVATDGFTYRTLLGQGVHVLQLSDTENGQPISDSVVSTSYPMAARDLPIPTAQSRWDVDTIINGYGDIYAEAQSQTWGQPITFRVGDCAFDALPGKIRYESDGFTVNEEVIYLPELSMSLLISYEDDGAPKDTWTYIDVEVAR
ncbi:hypothetical protein [Pseudooctadecabacter jejudonensis]|uniref:Uncharacterized protein n=1 Tax=Pseudooctadecabacter jejudonensis TaxID=1391910 RepID=A0A1Y5SHH4_9RHOB|nr:hypothetical protein [Pseudooctadecabacter jejudonensis]SLN40619.1 hypothetical protein PSJ8397_02021 [Pseudooctadecabacter jejudonensis]